MPWRECTMVDERYAFVREVDEGKRPFAASCRAFGISRKTGYKWWNRYRATGTVNVLVNQSRAPHKAPDRIDPAIEARVVALRQEYGFGARKLRVLLLREGINAAEATINRVIARHGLTKRQDVKGQATTRFERETPNDLWQMDFKGPIRLGDSDEYCHPLVIEDDHSRFLLGLFALPSFQGEPTRAAIRQVLARYSLPRQLLTDHGTPFYGNTNVHGLTFVSVDLMKQGIDLVHGAIRHPQTQGKLERLNRTIQEDVYFRGRPKTLEECQQMFDRFRQIYNEVRPHESLGMEVPASRYTPSAQPYRMPPVPWSYGDHMELHRLNTQGCLDYGGQRLFVCEALARETVGTVELNGTLIVQFRDMLIREIRLDTRRSTAILL